MVVRHAVTAAERTGQFSPLNATELGRGGKLNIRPSFPFYVQN